MVDRMIWCQRGWQPVHYGFCPSEAVWMREMRKMGVDPATCGYPESDGRTTFFDHPSGKSIAIVTVSDAAAKRRKKIEIVGLLIHEATHIWQHVQEMMGEKEPGEEMEAYAMQSISQELILAYSKTRRNLV